VAPKVDLTSVVASRDPHPSLIDARSRQ